MSISEAYVSFESLVGEHFLTGVDYETNGIGNGIRFVLDGKTYQVLEDEEDGYRSSAQPIEVMDAVVANSFSPVRVLAYTEDDGEILGLRDVVTGKEVISVGTGDYQDYYPYFINEFTPENMAINAKKDEA